MAVVKAYLNELEGNGTTQVEANSLEKQPLDNFEIGSYNIPSSKVMTYKELAGFNTVTNLFGTCKLIFLLYQPLVGPMGHWVLLWKVKNYFQYFCPYGLPIDAPITEWYQDGQPTYLGDLLRKTKNLDITYNAFDFQVKSREISTCGRWCVLRAQSITQNQMPLEDFIDLMREMKRVTSREYDNIVSDFISVS